MWWTGPSPHFPDSALIPDAATGSMIIGWIGEGDTSHDPDQVWQRCYQQTVDGATAAPSRCNC